MGVIPAVAAVSALAALDGSCLEILVQRLGVAVGLLRDLASGIDRGTAPDWSGAGQRAYVATASRLIAMARAKASELELACLALTSLAATLHSLQAEAAQAQRILFAGDPVEAAVVPGQLQLAVESFDDADRRAAALLLDALLGPALARSQTVLAVPLSTRASALVSDATRPRPLPADPVSVALWWAGLSGSAQAALVLQPDFGGAAADGLDGLPTHVRDARNRLRLASALATAQRHYAAVRSHHVIHDVSVLASWLPGPLHWVGALLDSDLRKAKQRVDALDALRRELTRPGSELLTFDAAGDGRAVVASGDPESSKGVAVLVPGMNSELEDVPRLVEESGTLAQAAGAGTVVIAWLGYDAPNVIQVASDAKAKTGALALRRFTSGLRATAAARQQVTVIGHSYGSLVAGLAERTAPVADDLVLLASPGVEASSAAELRVPAGHVWAARASTDPIQLVFWPARVTSWLGLPSPLVFGPDPAAPAFGAAHFAIGGAYGHSGYFTPGSQSVHNLGRLISGHVPTGS